MRICIYGAGAMGTSLGERLYGAGIPCELVTRNPAHAAALNGRGLRALLPEEMEGEYDVIFLAAKQRENRAIAQALLPFLGGKSALVTVQNGLPEAELASVLGADRVYGCTLSWGAERTDNGQVRITSEGGALALGAYGKGERLEEILSLLQKIGRAEAGALAEIRFAKLAVNASFSTLSAISGLTFYEIAKRHRRLALALMRETFAVARAAGCKKLPLNGHDLFLVFRKPYGALLLPIAMKEYRNTYSGMLKDLNEGRRCEVDFVAGAACRAGEECGAETPLLDRAVALVHDIENGLAEIAPESLALL